MGWASRGFGMQVQTYRSILWEQQQIWKKFDGWVVFVKVAEALWRLYLEKVIAGKFVTFWMDSSWQSNSSLKKNNASVLIFANEIHMLSNSLLPVGLDSICVVPNLQPFYSSQQQS